jgi:hypothetical protein
MPRKKQSGPAPEARMRGVAAAQASGRRRAIDSALSNVRSDTYNAGLRYVGGSGGKKAPFIPKEVYDNAFPAGMNPDDFKSRAQGAARHVNDAIKMGKLPAAKYIVEGYRNDALRARDAGDYESAQKLADAAKFFSAYNMTWGGKPQVKGGKFSPKGGKQSAKADKQQGGGDGYREPKEHNPLKRALGVVLGAPGVQQALKTVRMPYSYVASHVSDLAQEIEQGDVGGAIGALGRGVGLGVVGETADALQGKGFDIAGILNSYQNEKNRKDFWKQTGVGEYLQRGLNKHHWDDDTFLNDKWVKRGIGLAGDIGLDPLTYLTAGTTKLAGTSAEVATRVTEAGAELAAREGAAAAAAKAAEGASEAVQAAARKEAEDAAGEFARKTANTIIKKGKNRMSKADVARLFPEEKVAGGLAWRVPGTGRLSRGMVRGLTGGKVDIEEKLIPLLSKDVTNPMQRVLSKPARALGASKFADKAVGKFGGELGAELRGLIRSGEADTVYKGLGIKRAMNVMRSKAASSVRVSEETLRETFPDVADKYLINAGENSVGPTLSKLWIKEISPAIKGREAEIMKAIEQGTPEAVEGADKVAAFYRAAHKSLTDAGVPVGNIAEGQYIPRQFTEEGRKALQELAGDVPEGTTAVDPQVAFQKHRALLEELGVSNQAEARSMLEGLYGRNLKGKQVFETDLHKITANYIRQADQSMGRRAMLQELDKWGIALKDGEYDKYLKLAEEKSPKVAANNLVNKTLRNAPLSQKRQAQRAAQQVLEDQLAEAEQVAAQQVDEVIPEQVIAEQTSPLKERLRGPAETPVTAEQTSPLKERLRGPAETPVTAEQQAMMDAISEGVTGKPIPATDAVVDSLRQGLLDDLGLDITTADDDWIRATYGNDVADNIAQRYPRAPETPLNPPKVVSPIQQRFLDDFHSGIVNTTGDAVRDSGRIATRYNVKRAVAVKWLKELGIDMSKAEEWLRLPPAGGSAGRAMGDNLMSVTGDMVPENMGPDAFGGMPEPPQRLPAGLKRGGVHPELDPAAAYAQRVEAARARLTTWNDSVEQAAERIARTMALGDQDLRTILSETGFAADEFSDSPARIVEHLQGTRDALLEGGTNAELYVANKIQGHIDNLIPYSRGASTFDVNVLHGATFNPAAIPDNPTIADLDSLKGVLDSEIEGAAAGIVPSSAYEASTMADPAAGARILKAKQIYSEAVANHLRHAVSDASWLNKVKNVDAATGEIMHGGTEAIEEVLSSLENSPHWPEIERQLESLGAMERRAQAESDRPMEGLGRFNDLTDDPKFNVDDVGKVLGGENFDVKAAETAGDISGWTYDELNNQAKILRKRISEQNELLREAATENKKPIMMRLADLQDQLDEMINELWREGGPSTVEANVGREAGLQAAADRMGLDAEGIKALQQQRNLGDVYLGVQRLIDDAELAGMQIGQRSYAAMDGLGNAGESLFRVRLENPSTLFDIPSADVQAALEAQSGGNMAAFEDALLERSGSFVKNFVAMKNREIAAEIQNTLTAFEKNSQDVITQVAGVERGLPSTEVPTALGFDPVERVGNLQRQRFEIAVALRSGKPEEMIRVMLKQSVEGVGGEEFPHMLSSQLDEMSAAIRTGDSKAFDTALKNMELPAHPMSEGQLTGEARPRPVVDQTGPYVDPAVRAQVKQADWDSRAAFLRKRGRAIAERAQARGSWTPQELDQIRSLKKSFEALGERPRAAVAEAFARQQAEMDRLVTLYEEYVAEAKRMLDDGRIRRMSNGRLVGTDVESTAHLRKMRSIEESNPWQRANRSRWEHRDMAGRVVTRSELEAPLTKRMNELLKEKAGADPARVEEIKKEINAINRERTKIGKMYREDLGSRQKMAAVDIEYQNGVGKGRTLAQQRIKEGRIDETINKIEARLSSGEKFSPEQRGTLEGGLKTLKEHKAGIEATKEAVVASTPPRGGMVRSSANIWDDHAAGQYAVIPTNTVVKANGEAVMGAGLAKQARDKFEGLATRYGAHLRDAEINGTTAMMIDHENRLILIPTKTDWRLPSSVEQVDAALSELSTLDLPMSVPNLGAGKGQVALGDVEQLMVKHGVANPAEAPPSRVSGAGVTKGGPVPKGPMKISIMGDGLDEGAYIDPFVAAERRFEERMASGGVSMGVRGAIGGSEGGQDALNAAAAASEPEAALDDTARVLDGTNDNELVASIDEVHDDPTTPPRKRRVLRDAREWIGNKQTRVGSARVAAGGDATAEAAIALQSQAENGGLLRYMKYPTNDPVGTFQRLNNLNSIEGLAEMADKGLNNMAWLQKGQGYVTDQTTAEILNQITKVNTPEGMKQFLGYYDRTMTYIKAWQLTTPGFHVRNLMGGIFNNYLADVDIAATSRFLKNMKKFQAGKLTGEEEQWMKLIYENVGSGQYSHHEIGVAAGPTDSTWNPMSPRFKPLTASAKYGGDVEFRLRGALMWDRLSKGKGLQEALDDVTRYHFDYANLSNFEAGAVKRIVPFYVWTRYNFPLQMEMMATSPQKYRFYQQFKHSLEGRADKGKPVPEFLKNEMFGLPLPTHIGGGQNFLALDLPFTRTMAGATPDVENWDPTKFGTYPTLMDPYFSQMAVPIKLPAELALSRQFFKGIPLKDSPKTEGFLAGRISPFATAMGGKMKADYTAEQLMPLYGQMRRLLSTEKKFKDKRPTSWASYVGLPFRTNTKQDQENELARRRYLGK